MKKTILLLLLFGLSTLLVQAQDTYRDPAELADPDGKFVTVNDATVYYIDRGTADGEPVILLHGFLGSVVDWTNTIPALTDAGYRVIAFDRPPFGLSDKRIELDYSLKAMSALTIGLLDELGIRQAAVVGHSAGGAVAADVALLYPERVSRLVLVDGAVGFTGSDPQFGDERGGMDFLRNINPESPLAQTLLRNMLTSDFANSMMSQAVQDERNIDPELMKKRVRGLQVEGWEAGVLAFSRDSFTADSQFDLELLRTVQIPVLLVWGEQDRLVPINVGETLRDLFPNRTWITYPDVGHTPMDENTEQFNADLVTFLSEG